MLGATQKQLFNMDDSGNITGFSPYKAYGGTYNDKGEQIGYDPSKGIAGFTKMQQDAQRGVAGLTLPGQYGAASDITGASAAGALGTVGQAGMYGQQGSQAGQQYAGLSAGAGQQYAGLSAGAGQQGADIGQQAAGISNIYGMGAIGQGQQGANIGRSLGQQMTDPNSVNSYMNPYLQSALQPQLQEIGRQYDITGTQEMSNATRSGAFGGNREALMAAENQRNKNTAMNQVIGQGYNQAFNNAQQQMGVANQAALAGNAQAQTGFGQGLSAANQAGQLGLAGNQQALSGYGQAGQQALSGYGQAGSQSMQGIGLGLAGVGAQQAGYGQAGQAASSLANIGGQALQAQQGIYNMQNQYGGQQQGQQQQILNQSMQDYANAQQYPLMQLGTMSNMLRGLPMQATTTNQYVAAPNPVTQGIGLAGAGASIYNALKKEGGVIKEKKMAAGGIAGYNVGGSIRSKLYDMDAGEIQSYIKESASPAAKEIAEEVLRDKTGKAGGGIIAFADSTAENNQSVVKEDKPAPEDNAYLNRSRGLVEGVKNIVRPFTDLRNYDPLQKGSDVIRNTAQSIKEFGQEDLGEQARKFRAASSTRPAAVLVSETSAQAAPPDTPPATPAAALATTPVVNPAQPAKAAQTAKPAVDPAGIKAAAPTATVNKNDQFGPEAPVNPDAGKTLQQLIAEEKAMLGPNAGSQEQRAKLMAERANAKDEARRITSLRAAEFFGAWGSTPGNTIVAGLNTLKNKIPDFITDVKEESKMRKEIDKSIAELDKIDRDEEKGIIKNANERRAAASKNAFDVWGKKYEGEVHKYQADKHLQAASIRAANAGGEDKVINNLLMRAKGVDDSLNAYKKANEDLIKQANLPGDAPAVVKMRQAAQAKLDADPQYKSLTNRKAQIDGLLNQYQKIKDVGEGIDAAGTPAAGGVKATTQEEYSKLPKGAHYVDPNGITRIKG
jgi:hypothetical protein